MCTKHAKEHSLENKKKSEFVSHKLSKKRAHEAVKMVRVQKTRNLSYIQFEI